MKGSKVRKWEQGYHTLNEVQKEGGGWTLLDKKMKLRRTLKENHAG